MDYQKFSAELPKFYANWGEDDIQPLSNKFAEILDRMGGSTTANILQLLNLAVECLEADEIYCQIGCDRGVRLIGALLNQPESMAYAVDNFTEFDETEENLAQLGENLSQFNLDDRVLFCNLDFEEFFFDLAQIDPDSKIGVYFYDGAHDYRSQLLGLMLVRPFLAPKALIIIDDSNYSCVKQASWDFLAAHPQSQLVLDLATAKDAHRSFGNGIQIISWDRDRTTLDDWENFASKFRDRHLIKAIKDFHCEFEFNQKPATVQQLHQQAAELIDRGDSEAAEQKYIEALKWQRNNANIWHDLGMLYFEQSRYRDAISAVGKCLKLDGTKALFHYSMGLILSEFRNYDIASEAYKKAIDLDKKMLVAYLNLGNVLVTFKKFTEAESLYHQALEVPLEHFGIYNNLANILTTLNKFSEAQEYYEKALELEPEDEDVINSLKIVRQIQEEPLKQDWFLGVWAKDKSEYDKAISHFKKYLENHTEDLDCYFRIGFCYEKKKKSAEAIEYYKKVLEYDPKVKYAYLRIISTFLEIGNIQKAQNYADKAANLFPDNLALKLQRQQILPRLYDSTEEIDFYRDRFEKELDSIIENTSLEDKESKANALIGISNTNNFYLNYQGRNDVELHKKYGQFVHRVMTANYPDLVKPLPMPPLADGEKIRVGYVCSCFRHHSVSKLFLGWFENYDREKFEFHCYYPHSIFDEVTNKYKLASKSFYHNPTNSYEIDEVLKPFYKKILADKLHILVYLDIGQLSTIHLMAGLRLAPIQCQTWAHPITSGIPTIDYFLSSNLMEPENGQSHYAETLIRLPNIGVCFTKPGLPENPKGRSDLELPENATIYLCCQNLIKYLPKYDYIFAAIAKEVPDAKFTFLSLARDEVIEQFKARLQRAFARFDLDSEQFCIILPKLNFSDYLSLNLVSDIFLDSFAWSGGVTTLEAIACNLPVVTCPGEFMRGRHTYGILQMLGVTETIAKDEREYIEIAVRLGKNQALRANIADKIANNHSRLYGDLTCVRAVEEFYQRVVREYSLEI